jgi:hypothetical protein
MALPSFASPVQLKVRRPLLSRVMQPIGVGYTLAEVDQPKLTAANQGNRPEFLKL